MNENDLFDKSELLIEEAIAINNAVMTARSAAKYAIKNVRSIKINKPVKPTNKIISSKVKKPHKKSKRNKKK